MKYIIWYVVITSGIALWTLVKDEPYNDNKAKRVGTFLWCFAIGWLVLTVRIMHKCIE